MRVLTLTANLLAETTYTFESWTEGATQRARAESFQVGGKGINVTKMLGRLGMESLALCFPGGATGTRCETWLRQAGIPFRAFPTEAETRSGAVVRVAGRAETTFLGAENVVSREAVRRCADFLEEQPPGDLLVVAGSIPAWHEAAWDSLRAALERWMLRGTLVVDTYGPPLRWFARLPASVVKINRREFATLVGVDPGEMADDARMPAWLEQAAREHRPQRWVITDGPNRVWFQDRDGPTCSLLPPRVEEVSPTGSGDVLTAGLIYALGVRKLDLAGAVAFALPLAAANAASPGVADFSLAAAQPN